MRKIHLLFLFVFIILFSQGHAASWAQKTLDEMSVDEKIGQLFMIAGYVDHEFAAQETQNTHIIEDIDRFVTQYFVGGITLVGPSNAAKQVALLNRYQQMSKYPLLIAQDLEWGLSMRLTDGMRFPKNITLGALKDNQLIYEMGREIGRQGRLVGVHMNLSPVLDVNIEPENLAINIRSFGDSPENVARKGVAMIQGLQDANMIASCKHFPGLGDITTDPHLGLPSNVHDRARLEQVELYPFIEAVKAGVMSIQTEHVCMPALEPDVTLPASLSPKIVQGILKDKIGFEGLVLSGALRMKALTNHFSQEEIAVRAFLAGSDMLLMPEDLPRAYHAIKQAVLDGRIAPMQIDQRVLKILQMKEQLALDRKRFQSAPSEQELHTTKAQALKRKLYESAISLVRDKNGLLPAKAAGVGAYVQFGDAPSNVFYKAIKEKIAVEPFFLPLAFDDSAQADALLLRLKNYPFVIVAIYPLDPRRIAQIRLLAGQKQVEELKNFRVHGLPVSFVNLIPSITRSNKNIVMSYFGNPFGLHFFDGFSTFIMGYEDDPEAQSVAASMVIGKN